MKKNEGKASHYFKVAVDCEMSNAQLNIGMMLMKGNGVANDVVLSVK